MITFEVENLTNHETFLMKFLTLEDARKYRIKCDYSKRVKIINAFGFLNSDEERRVFYGAKAFNFKKHS